MKSSFERSVMRYMLFNFVTKNQLYHLIHGIAICMLSVYYYYKPEKRRERILLSYHFIFKEYPYPLMHDLCEQAGHNHESWRNAII